MVRYATSRREARALLEELRRLARPAGGSGRTTVGQYLRSWLDTAGRRSLKASTWTTYDVALRLHIDPALGHLTLSRLSAEHVDAMLSRLDLSPKGQRNVLGFLGRVLDVALARGLVVRNAARLVDPPRVIHQEPAALTVAEGRRILDAVAGDRLEALWVTALATGMRQAELLGLRWQDVDLDAATLHVAFALARRAGDYVLDEPKSPKSRRTISLPAFAVAALREHRARQLVERLAAGRPTDDGLVFVSPTGRPLNGGWVSHRWPALARKAKVATTMHGLRHGQSSLLVAAGTHPRVIAGRLGHATIAQTMDRYAHVAEASDRDAAAALEEALGIAGTVTVTVNGG
jgi:integrase